MPNNPVLEGLIMDLGSTSRVNKLRAAYLLAKLYNIELKEEVEAEIKDMITYRIEAAEKTVELALNDPLNDMIPEEPLRVLARAEELYQTIIMEIHSRIRAVPTGVYGVPR